MRRKPKGTWVCGICKKQITEKDLIWHDGLGGNWIHGECYLAWEKERNVDQRIEKER